MFKNCLKETRVHILLPYLDLNVCYSNYFALKEYRYY